MSSNARAVQILREIGDLLDLQGEKFKPEAYRRAARSIESLSEELQKVAARDELRSIPGVGDAIEEKLREFLRTGTIEYYDRLRKEVPPGIVELMHLGGIGPKTARRLWVELGIEGPAELITAIDAGKLVGLAGFKDRKIAQLREAVARTGGPTDQRRLFADVWPIAQRLLDELRRRAPVDQVELAGSVRRRRETIGDLDVLVTARDAEKVFDVASKLPEVQSIVLRGPTKETLIYQPGIQVDIRVLAPESFGAALQYFTGSKDHNVRLRSIARDRGLKINEYGVFRGDERIAGATEADVYATLGLPLIPPEIRENQGEIDAALVGTVPTLVEEPDLHGDLHVHLDHRATVPDVDRLLAEAHTRGWSYLGVVVAAPGGGSGTGEPAPEVLTRITNLRRAKSKQSPALFLGWEGAVPPSAEQTTAYTPDYWVLALGPENRTATPPPRREPAPLFAGHLATGARAGAEEAAFSAVWLPWAREHSVALEMTPRPGVDGLDSASARLAGAAGVKLHLTGDARVDTIGTQIGLTVGFARRGWIEKGSVLNALPDGAFIGSGRSRRKPSTR
ncbi:MAG: helix-hairpin-helix domain-containing protein [Thermoplasmata archaeon]